MNPAEPLADMFRAWSALAGSVPGLAATGAAGTVAPLDALLAQAHLASSASLLRAGQRAGESWMQYLKEAGAEGLLAQRVDAARGHLRRLGEIAADEARLVGQQMLALDERACGLVNAAAAGPAERKAQDAPDPAPPSAATPQDADPPDALAAPRRRARAKP